MWKGLKHRVERHVSATSIALLCAATTAFAEDRAVVIGIDDYSALGHQVALKGAVADAKAFRNFLVEHWGFRSDQVTLMTDGDASSPAIMDAVIDELIGKTDSGDRVVFYFAGLGGRVGGDTDETDAKSKVLLSHDADTFLGKLPETVLSDLFDLLEDRNVTLVIDASVAGTAALGESAPGEIGTRGVALTDTKDEDRGEITAATPTTGAISPQELPFGPVAQSAQFGMLLLRRNTHGRQVGAVYSPSCSLTPWPRGWPI